MTQQRVHKQDTDMQNIRRIGLTLYVRFIIPRDRWADCECRELSRRSRRAI